MTSGENALEALAFLQGGGEMGALIRRMDWTAVALGSPDSWPQSLRSAVSICLGSGFPIAIYWGPQLALLYNDAWSPIAGAKHPWAVGRPAQEVWPEIWDTIGPLFEHALTTGEATRSKDQLLAMRRHGYTEECYFDYTFSPIRAESGHVEGIFNAVLETTERVISERRLRTIRELAGRVAEAQTARLACRVSMQTLENASGDLPFALLYLADAGAGAVLSGMAGLDAGSPASAAGAWPLTQVLRSGVPELVQGLHSRFGSLPGGPWPEPADSALVLPVLRTGSEDPYGVLVAGLSPRRELDSDYRAFLDVVASHIARGLAHAEAYEGERRRAEALAEIDRAKTAFFSNVSHEFRTPLTLMLGPLEDVLSRKGDLSSGLWETLSVVQRNGLRLQKLVNSLLDFSRIEAGRARVSYEPVDLASLTADLASTFRPAIEQAGLQLIVECPRLPQPVNVDRDLWEKVVLNLLSNAFKYTLEGRITVRIGADGEFARLSITDTGTGIPEHELPHIFERFHRVAGARGRTQEGTGIGLALVSELVRLHGGTVTVESAVGQGSTFTVSVPFGAANLPGERLGVDRDPGSTALHAAAYVEEAARWIPDGRVAGSSATGDKSTARVLVVDDNADMRGYVGKLLLEHYDVETAADGVAALAGILRNPPDLVVSDVMMPGLDGFQLLRVLRENPLTRGVPVILLSARTGQDARVEGLYAGASDYLEKPFTARELVTRVGTQLEIARLRRQASEQEASLRAEAEAARDKAVGVLESITDGFFTLDRDWCFTYANAAAEKLLRASRADLLGRNHWELYPQVLGTTGEREYRRAARDRVPVEFEFCYESRDRWYAVKAYPTEQGGISVYFRDITEQRLAEARLRESRERLRAIYDGTYEYIGLLSPDGTLLEANRASLEFAGNTREEVVGRPFWDSPWFTGTPGAAEAVRRGVARAAEGESVRFEAKLRRPTGDWLDFDISLHPIRSESGEVVLIVPEGRNITDYKQVEEQLRQQWHTFDTALSHTPDFTYTFDLEGRFTYVNRALLSLWQKSLEEARGKNFFELGYPPDLAARLQSQIQQVVDTRKPVRDHTPFTGPTGETREYEYIFVPVLGSSGEVEAVAGSTRDVTERKQAEEQERERQAQLLDSARLESLGVMAGGIAHDFNNILVGILGNASLLTETVQKEDRPLAADIMLAAERAAELTSQMLAYSGKGRFVIEVLDLNQLIQENLTLLRASLSRSVSVQLEFGCDSCPVEVDRTQIHQVVMNLLINASEAIGERPGNVAIRTAIIERSHSRYSAHLRAAVPPGSYALVEVEDNGIGMPVEVLRKIFEPFFTTKFTGRGLGLAAVLGIVKGHNGDIDVESRPGLGTTFRIYLPVAERAAALPPRPQPAAPIRKRGQTVLVVDDEEIVRKTATVALKREGFQVLLATNGAEAIEMLRTTPGISLVILDLTMPVMTGEQALPLMRNMRPELPVILSSGFNETEIYRRFASSGIAGVLQKPYRLSAIAHKVAQALESALPAA